MFKLLKVQNDLGNIKPSWTSTILDQSIPTFVRPLFQIDNEENVLICLRVVIELHKQYRPQITPDVSILFNHLHHEVHA